jgi:outer membrane lipase/esterase
MYAVAQTTQFIAHEEPNMKIKKLVSAIALAFAGMTCAVSPVHAQTVTQLNVLGDSLSDAGAAALLVAPSTGRWTTNPDPVYSMIMASRMGLPAGPAFFYTPSGLAAQPGNNYAQGGARVSTVAAGPGGVPVIPLTTQTDLLLQRNGGRLDKNSLNIVWMGANDIGATLRGAMTPADAIAQTQIIAQQVGRIRSAGSQLVVVLTVPNLGVTPFGAAIGPAGAGQATALTEQFNAALMQSLVGSNALIVDSNKLLSALVADPGRFGFTVGNTGVACGASPSLVCVNPPNATQFLFADDVHPSGAAHSILASALLSGVYAPAQFGTMLAAPMISHRQHVLGLEPRLSLLSFSGPADGTKKTLRREGSVDVFGGIEYGSFGADAKNAQPGNDASDIVALVGADYQVARNVVLGGALSMTRGKVEFDQGSGYFKTDQIGIYGYATVALSPKAWVSAMASYSDLDYKDIQREAVLPTTKLLAKGSTNGKITYLRLGGGYNFGDNSLAWGPIAAYTAEKVTVDGYQEADSPISLGFGSSSYKSNRLSLGGQVSFMPDGQKIKPFARITLEQDLEKDPLKITIKSTPINSATIDGDRPDRTFALLSVGATADIVKGVQLFGGINATAAQKGVSGWSIGIGAKANF